MDENVRAFLSDFDNYWYALYPHKTIKSDIKDIKVNRSLQAALVINAETPSNLYLVPNFKYWDTNKEWDPLNLSEANAWDPSRMCAFVLDFNLSSSESKNMDEFLKEIRNKLAKRLIWKYKYIVRTPNGYHVYFVIKKWERKQASTLFKDSYFSILNRLARELWANIDPKLTKRKGALYRMPWSVYWTLEDKYEVNFVSFTKDEIGCTDISAVEDYIREVEKWEERERTIKKRYGQVAFNSVMNIPLELFKQSLGNRDEYYIDNESKTVTGMIGSNLKEMPVGTPYQVAWHASWQEETATMRYLIDNYEIEDQSLTSWEIDSEWVSYKLNGNGYEILFQGPMVQLTQQVVSPKGELMNKSKIIFRNRMKIIGKWYTTKSSLWESITPTLALVVEVDGVERILYQQPSKSTHNKQYTDVFFFWDDNDLGLFYNGIVSDNNIPILNIYERTGYYDWDMVFWDRMLIWNSELSRVLLWENEFSICNHDGQISVYEYFSRFKKCYKEEFAVPLFLCALALAGMNLWNSLEVNPAVLVSGTTGCGKSTVAALLKKMLWYEASVREMALPSVSPQPLKQLASDNAILFLEELTAKVSPYTEELLRNIVNRDKAARGTLDWTVWRNFRSPLWVNGERTFKDESLNNRFCGFIMSSDYWLENGWEEINELLKYTAYREIYETYNTLWYSINDKLMYYKSQLLDSGLPSRACDVWSYMFVVNDIFDFGYSFNTLLGYVKTHLWKTGLGAKKVKDPIWAFSKLVSAAIINRKMSATVTNSRYIRGKPYIIMTIIYLDSDVYQMNRGALYSAVDELNKELWEELIEIDDTAITFYLENTRVSGKRWTDKQYLMADIIESTLGMLPTNIRNNIRGIQYVDRDNF